MFLMKTRQAPRLALAALFVATLVAGAAGAFPPGDKPVPPGKSGDDHGRIAAFVAALNAGGFDTSEGGADAIRPFDMVNSGYVDSCGGNNAGQYYKRLRVPPRPGQPNIDFIFQLAPDEAVVYVGKTPPMADYFSFCAFLWSRQYPDSCMPTGDWLFPAVHDPLNNAWIRTEGQGSPFQKNTIIVLTADEGIYERVRNAAGKANYPASMVNQMVLPSNVLRLGTEPGSDWLFVLVRTANIVSKAQEEKYLADTEWARVFRVTPRVAPELHPFAPPPWRDRVWKSEETLVPGVTAGLERLKAAILEKTPHVQARPLESVRWIYDSKDVLADIPGTPAYRQWVAGDSSDSPYRRSAEDGQPTNFLLGDDDMAVVYGVNHAATGIATYSSFGVYGDWVLNHCPLQPGESPTLFGAGGPIWNGVASMTNHEFTGSAEQYLPGDPMAPYLYAVRVVRKARAVARDPYSVVVPETNSKFTHPPYTDIIGLDQPMMVGYRAYLNPATKAGPAYEDTIADRVIWFRMQ